MLCYIMTWLRRIYWILVSSDSEHNIAQPEVRPYFEPEDLKVLKLSLYEFLRRGEQKGKRRNRALGLIAFSFLHGFLFF